MDINKTFVRIQILREYPINFILLTVFLFLGQFHTMLEWRNISYLLTLIHFILYSILIVWKNKISHHFAANRYTFLGLSFHKLPSPLEVEDLINPVMYLKRCVPFIKWEVILISCYYFETHEILSVSLFFCLTCL